MTTTQFCGKYLIPGGTGRGYGLYRMVADSRGTDKKMIYGRIRRMSYSEFLQTRYWNVTAQQVKHDAGWKCSVCGSRQDLVVHHSDYRHHGAEMYHTNELQCLCRQCHERLHNLEPEENAN